MIGLGPEWFFSHSPKEPFVRLMAVSARLRRW